MAKRYYTTDLFDDSWFMDLPSKYKLFWIYLLTKCNHSGIWQVNWKLAQFYTGDNLEPTEVQRILKDRIISIENNKYWFIPKFIEFQYGDKLNPDSTVHKGIVENIKKYNLFEFLPKIEIFGRVNKGLTKPLQRIKDQDQDKDKDQDKEEWFANLLPEDSKKEFIDAWKEWVSFRKEIKKKITQSTAKKQINFLLAQPNPAKCIEQSIQNGWQGLFEEKNNGNTASGTGFGKNSGISRNHEYVKPKESKYNYK